MTAPTNPATWRVGDGRRPHQGLQLREEDLEVGRPFVHPETRLEYEDFHAYLAGKDPLPHWRNARIKEILAACWDLSGDLDFVVKGCDTWRAERIAYFCRAYTRDGYLYAARGPEPHAAS